MTGAKCDTPFRVICGFLLLLPPYERRLVRWFLFRAIAQRKNLLHTATSAAALHEEAHAITNR